MKLHFSTQFRHRKIYYRTLDAAVLKAVAYLKNQMHEKHPIRELHVLNGSSHACRLYAVHLAVGAEICIRYTY